MTDSSEAKTDRMAKGIDSVLLKIGNHKLTVPVTTLALGILTALGTAYTVVKNDRADILGRIDSLEKADTAQSQKQELQQIVLVEIRTQLARIDARVAEVQVTLMRGGAR